MGEVFFSLNKYIMMYICSDAWQRQTDIPRTGRAKNWCEIPRTKRARKLIRVKEPKSSWSSFQSNRPRLNSEHDLYSTGELLVLELSARNILLRYVSGVRISGQNFPELLIQRSEPNFYSNCRNKVNFC